MPKMYIIYDGRAIYDEDDAMVMDTAHSIEEAKQVVDEADTDWVVFEYDVNDDILENGTMVYVGGTNG
jgi:hypothetical protein